MKTNSDPPNPAILLACKITLQAYTQPYSPEHSPEYFWLHNENQIYKSDDFLHHFW